MNEFQIVALIALLGSLVLVGRGISGRGLRGAKGITLAAIWLGLFLIVTLFVSLVADV